MAKLARMPIFDRSPEAGGKDDIRGLRTRFYAFLSYSHQDKELADWLQREIERFKVPSSLAGKLTGNGVVPRRLSPIFRDEPDLSAGADLAEGIKAALAASQFLIVLCSPGAAKSRWTNQEIESFKRTRPEGCVLAAIAAGEPYASDMQGREAEECFPPALRYKYDRRGHQTAKRAEPLAADFRGNAESRRLALLKLVAGMLGVGLDELVQRDQTRRHRHLAWLAAASLAGMAVTSTLAVVAWDARNSAREQRREAEGLVAFMLGDLKDKLEPIGRLDALDGVGSKVLTYYSRQDTSQLTDAGLSQRSEALSLTARVANARGDAPGALKLYREAMAGTAEAIRRHPDKPEPYFDHAQNVFYVGEIAQHSGDLKTAESSMRDYQRLARQMIALQPDSMKYRMEEQYADTDLGVVLYDQRRFTEAATQFNAGLRTMEAISTADPGNKDYRTGVAESLAWLADSQRAIGNYLSAIASRQRNIALYDQLFIQTADVKYREHAIASMRSLANLYADRGQHDLAIQQYRAAIETADKLTAVEPGNARWLEYGYRARLGLGSASLANGRLDDAETAAVSGCQIIHKLMAQPSPAPEWTNGSLSCTLLSVQIAKARGAKDQATALAQQAVATARGVHSVDKVADAWRLVKAFRLLGDVSRDRGDLIAARNAWTSALTTMPVGLPELPDEIAEHAFILQRLDRKADAQPLLEKLSSMGYRALG